MMAPEEVFARLKKILVEQFDLDEDAVTLQARLYQDLDIDSIDAVDLMVELKEMTGKILDPEVYKKIRTVGDIVEALCARELA